MAKFTWKKGLYTLSSRARLQTSKLSSESKMLSVLLLASRFDQACPSLSNSRDLFHPPPLFQTCSSIHLDQNVLTASRYHAFIKLLWLMLNAPLDLHGNMSMKQHASTRPSSAVTANTELYLESRVDKHTTDAPKGIWLLWQIISFHWQTKEKISVLQGTGNRDSKSWLKMLNLKYISADLVSAISTTPPCQEDNYVEKSWYLMSQFM